MKRGLLIAGFALLLGACASWPDEGGGGLAERRPTEEPRLEQALRRFEGQRARGAETHAAGLSHEISTLFVRAQRNKAAGILDDLELDLIRLGTLLDAIERRLPRKS